MANSPFCYKTHKQCFWLVWYGKERQAEKGSWKQRLGWRKEGREEVGKVGRVAVNNDTRTVSLRLVWQTHTLCIHHKVINQTKSHCIFALREWHSIKTITLTWHGDTGIKRVCECWQRWVQVLVLAMRARPLKCFHCYCVFWLSQMRGDAIHALRSALLTEQL